MLFFFFNVFKVVFWFLPQYSEKEDKYEEEIKLLSDKLKEVSNLTQLVRFPLGLVLEAVAVTPVFSFRLRPVLNLQSERLQNWKSQLMTWKV